MSQTLSWVLVLNVSRVSLYPASWLSWRSFFSTAEPTLCPPCILILTVTLSERQTCCLALIDDAERTCSLLTFLVFLKQNTNISQRIYIAIKQFYSILVIIFTLICVDSSRAAFVHRCAHAHSDASTLTCHSVSLYSFCLVCLIH